MVIVRAAQPDDARAIATVHVRAWRSAYRGGLMPDAYLDALSVEERTAMWERGLARTPRPGAARLVAADDRGHLTGFIMVGPAGSSTEAGEGEVYALNVDPDAWGQGVGRTLLAAGTDELRAAGFPTAVLWVHPGNARACRFYEAAGWQADGGQRTEDVLGVEVPEVRYRRSLALVEADESSRR